MITCKYLHEVKYLPGEKSPGKKMSSIKRWDFLNCQLQIQDLKDSECECFTFACLVMSAVCVCLSRFQPPKVIKRYTLLKSVHIYSKHMVQYEARTHYTVFEVCPVVPLFLTDLREKVWVCVVIRVWPSIKLSCWLTGQPGDCLLSLNIDFLGHCKCDQGQAEVRATSNC